MNNEQNLSDKDPDYQTAQLYGKMLEGDKTLSSQDDELLSLLLKLRETENQELSDIRVENIEKSWDKIESQILLNKKSGNATIHKLSSNIRWYAAAVILITVSLSLIFYFENFTTDQTLIADSGTNITTVELADGSVVTLRPNSQLRQLAFNNSEHSYALQGEALFDVSPQDQRTFSVESGPGRVVVTGTKFNLHDRSNQSTVYLIEGAVRFESSDKNQFVNLSSGEAAVINDQNILLESFQFTENEVTGWTNNRLNFQNRTATSIFSELEFHFNVTIIASDEISSEVLGGSITLTNIQESLSDLGIVLGGNFIEVEDDVFTFTPDA